MKSVSFLVLATTNLGKLEEFRDLFKAYPNITTVDLSSVVRNASSLSRVESAQTYDENALRKGLLAHHASKAPTLSEDAGLEVDALQGAPGVRSHRYATLSLGGSTGRSGVENQDQANNKKLLEALKGVAPEKRTARFVSSQVLVMEGIILRATGVLEGTILEAPRGQGGFGYDPLFLVKGTQQTLAELSIEQKNQISHRALALKSLMDQLKQNHLDLVKPNSVHLA